MSHQQAKALVWDHSALHHWTVWVLPPCQGIEVWCSDCDHVEVFSLKAAHAIRQTAEMAGGVQIVTWVEVPSEQGEAITGRFVGHDTKGGARSCEESPSRAANAANN